VNWTLLQAKATIKMLLRPLNASYYQDDAGTDQPLTDLLNEGIGDLCSSKAPYMLWSNTDAPAVDVKLLMLDEDMLSVKRVEHLSTATDEHPRVLRRPEDYDIHETYLEFTYPRSGVFQILGTRHPSLLVDDTDLMPFGSPFQLAVVYYAAAALTMAGGNAGATLSSQYMAMFQRIKNVWEQQTMNEGTSLRGQSNNPANYDEDDLLNYRDIPRGHIEI
jgi:hypothetical protein